MRFIFLCLALAPAAALADVSAEDLAQIRAVIHEQTDRAGAVWLAYYAMQRLEDGRWSTSGCRLLQPARSISA